MNKIVRIAAIIFCGSLISGCTGLIALVNGTDASIPRSVKPIDGVFVVEVQYQDRPAIRKEIRCEKYYDAMAATRGNYWAIREVGFESEYQTSKIEILDGNIGTILFPMPPAETLVKKKEFPLKYLILQINGNPYWPKTSTGNKHIYFRPAMHNNGVEESVTLNFVYKINGIAIK